MLPASHKRFRPTPDIARTYMHLHPLTYPWPSCNHFTASKCFLARESKNWLSISLSMCHQNHIQSFDQVYTKCVTPMYKYIYIYTRFTIIYVIIYLALYLFMAQHSCAETGPTHEVNTYILTKHVSTSEGIDRG